MLQSIVTIVTLSVVVRFLILKFWCVTWQPVSDAYRQVTFSKQDQSFMADHWSTRQNDYTSDRLRRESDEKDEYGRFDANRHREISAGFGSVQRDSLLAVAESLGRTRRWSF